MHIILIREEKINDIILIYPMIIKNKIMTKISEDIIKIFSAFLVCMISWILICTKFIELIKKSCLHKKIIIINEMTKKKISKIRFIFICGLTNFFI